MTLAPTLSPFDIIGSPDPVSPVVIAVPHAGRDYPPALRAALRVPLDALRPLEDRHVDTLALAARGRESMIVARHARAWIDLNRGELDRDPQVDEGARPAGMTRLSHKVRSGLGLVPRRAGGAGALWMRRFSDAEVTTRIANDHRPYHAALSAMLGAARARFGVAILLDIHSMPSLTGDKPPVIVIGDRFGRASASRFVARIEEAAMAAGHHVAINSPYAGGHVLDRHATPHRGIHAVQIEFDRALYLDAVGDVPGPGFAAAATLLRRMINAVLDESVPGAMAAE